MKSNEKTVRGGHNCTLLYTLSLVAAVDVAKQLVSKPVQASHTVGMKSKATKLIVVTCPAKGVGPKKPMIKAQISQNHLRDLTY